MVWIGWKNHKDLLLLAIVATVGARFQKLRTMLLLWMIPLMLMLIRLVLIVVAAQ